MSKIKEFFEVLAFLAIMAALFYSLKYAQQIDQLLIMMRG
jgi:hypothetical protein|tara:strand:- start:198 stop:317 length:120 start_codon:yes stop_codon:yes gene_type:complete